MKNESFRFLPEYANHKRRYVKRYTSDEETLAEKLKEIDKIMFMATHGYIILDEAMRYLSNV